MYIHNQSDVSWWGSVLSCFVSLKLSTNSSPTSVFIVSFVVCVVSTHIVPVTQPQWSSPLTNIYNIYCIHYGSVPEVSLTADRHSMFSDFSFLISLFLHYLETSRTTKLSLCVQTMWFKHKCLDLNNKNKHRGYKAPSSFIQKVLI